MQEETQNNQQLDIFSKVHCSKHPSEPIRFLCISSEICSKENLLCTECIDSSGRDHSHQLISVRRFHSFLRAYSGQALCYTQKAEEAIRNLKKEIDQQIKNLEYLSTCQLNLGLDESISSEGFLRTKLQELACKNIWSKLHEKAHKEEDIELQMEEQIQQYWEPTANAIKELLNLIKISCQNLENTYNSLKDDSSSDNDKIRKIQKRQTVLKAIPIVDEIESDEDDDEDQDDIQMDENCEYKDPTSKKNSCKKSKKISKVKRYTKGEKLHILNEVRQYTIQMNSSLCKKMIAQKYKIAPSTLLRWEKWYAKEYGNGIAKNDEIEEIKIQDSA